MEAPLVRVNEGTRTKTRLYRGNSESQTQDDHKNKAKESERIRC